MVDWCGWRRWRSLRSLLAALIEAAEEEDPLLRSLRAAPADDEAETDAERSPVEEALQKVREGKPGLSTAELKRQLGLA